MRMYLELPFLSRLLLPNPYLLSCHFSGFCFLFSCIFSELSRHLEYHTDLGLLLHPQGIQCGLGLGFGIPSFLDFALETVLLILGDIDFSLLLPDFLVPRLQFTLLFFDLPGEALRLA